MPRPIEFDRNKVIRQAMDVFWQKGYEATSIYDLTVATNLKPGSLYNTFTSKHAIYLETLDYYEKYVGSAIFQVLDEPISGITAIQTVFTNLIEQELSDVLGRGCFMQNAIMERASLDADVEQRACLGKKQGVEAFKRALERAQNAGEINVNLNLDQTAYYLLGIVYAIRTMSRTTKVRSELEGMVKIALSVLA